MSFARSTRILAAFLAAAGLLFSQLAVSAYSCMAMGMQAESAMDNENLCERHCNYGSASLDAAQPWSPLPAASAPPIRIVPMEVPAVAIEALRDEWPAEGPAPPLIRFTVLRI